MTIEVCQLQKSFGTRRVLDGVALRIEQAEAAVIIGRSGGGKSILLKLLIGLIQPDAGEILVDGVNLCGLDERSLLGVRRQFGMLFQSAALFDSMTVAENVNFLLRRERQHTAAELDQKVAEALELVDLAGTQNLKPAELSGGMRKRVGLARAIVYRPRIVLYDEPTTGLDPIGADGIDRLISRVCEHLGVTTVVVTHDMRSMRTIADRVLMLHQGRIHATGTPDEMFHSPDPIVRRFVEGTSNPHEIEL